jgi:DNA-binding GntR family transcriptional regulator
MRVVADIEARIASGDLGPGARLLSERDLATHYGVAFHTIRHAMAILRERGRLVTIHGRGNYVTEPGQNAQPGKAASPPGTGSTPETGGPGGD